MDNNTLTITSNLGPLTIFRSPSFIPYAQFDEDYLVTIPFHMYIVYVPIGFSYSIN